jgi:hypothetical protein
MKNTNMATARELPKIVNGVSVDDLFLTIGAIKATPAIAKFNFRIHNQWESAAQNSSTVDTFYGASQEQARAKPFVLEADEPAVLLGKDMAANPVEHLHHFPSEDYEPNRRLIDGCNGVFRPGLLGGSMRLTNNEAIHERK